MVIPQFTAAFAVDTAYIRHYTVTMRTNLARWGNSLAVRLPRDVTEELHLTEGTPVEIEIKSGAVTLRPARPRYRLEDLLRGVTPRAMRDAWSWGRDRGREAVDD